MLLHLSLYVFLLFLLFYSFHYFVARFNALLYKILKSGVIPPTGYIQPLLLLDHIKNLIEKCIESSDKVAGYTPWGG
jgi:hypothetical protein